MPNIATERYTKLQAGLHWLIVLLFAFNWIVSDGMGRALRTKLEGGSPDGWVATLHPPVGVAILVLMLIRIALRWKQGAPAHPTDGNPLLEKAAQWTHWLLYALLIAIPVAGIAAWQFGIRDAGEVHEILVNAAVVLIALHVAAALYHQLILKDHLMARMKLRD